MKIYHTKLTTQNLGSSILIILRGNIEDIKETFNSLYNWGACNGSLSYPTQNVGVCWVTRASLARYWRNIFINNHLDKEKELLAFVEQKIEEMLEESEAFMDFSKKVVSFEEYESGSIIAERPDETFQDKVLEYAFSDKN
jgi:hypothetical protein